MSVEERRKLLKGTLIVGGAVVGAKSLPESWSRPIVDAVMLPAHAQTSPLIEDNACSSSVTLPGCTFSCSDTSEDSDSKVYTFQFDGSCLTFTEEDVFASSNSGSYDPNQLGVRCGPGSGDSILALWRTVEGGPTAIQDCSDPDDGFESTTTRTMQVGGVDFDVTATTSRTETTVAISEITVSPSS